MDDLARELEKEIIRRHAEFDAWWEEQWRRNEAVERRINDLDERVGERFNKGEGRLDAMEGEMQDMGKWRAEVRVASLLGSVIGSAVMSVIVGFIIWRLTGSKP